MDFSSLEVFDYIIITMVGLSTLIAFMKGFLKTTLSLIVWVGAIIASFYMVPVVQPIVSNHVESAMSVAVLSFTLAIIASFVLLLVITIPINTILSPIAKGAMDRTLGFAFGLLRGIVLACALFITIILLDVVVNGPSDEEEEIAEETSGDIFIDNVVSNRVGPIWLQESQTYSSLRIGSRFILDLLPENLFENAEKALANLKKEGKEEAEDQMLDIIDKALEQTDTVTSEKPSEETPSKITNSVKGLIGEKQLESLKKEWKSHTKTEKPIETNTPKLSKDEGYNKEQIEALDGLIEQFQ